jgi:hypothetical protein
MSSVLSAYAQIPARSKYLFVPRASNHGGFTAAQLSARISADAANVMYNDGTVLNTTDAWSFIGGMAYDFGINRLELGDVYRDMGKELHISQDGVKIAVFRYAQKVDDGNNFAEGFGTHPNLWICTWVGAGPFCPESYGMVKVVRTG